MGVGVIPWNKPPDNPWTSDQRERREREQAQYMRSRTEDRSDASVADGVAKLKELLATPERQKMIVQIIWKRGGDGKLVVNQKPPTERQWGKHADGMNGEWNTWGDPGSAPIIMLDHRGLHYVVPDQPNRQHLGPGHWEKLSESAFPEIVRYFQLFPDDLEELIKLLRMD